MALQTINLSELKYRQDRLTSLKDSYDETLNNLMDEVKMIAFYWQGNDSSLLRNELYKLIGTDLNNISNEIEAEIDYIKRLILVLENANDQIKNRLNG